MAEAIPRQVKVVGTAAAVNPHTLWEASSAGYLKHIKKETDGDGRMIRDEVLHPAMLDHLGPMAGKKVFDAGCGDGILSRTLKEQGAQVIGGDFTFDFASAAHTSTPPISAMNADVAHLPIQNESFDALISNLVLMWVPDLDRSIEEFARILKPGGRAVISITHPDFNLGKFNLEDEAHPQLILSESVREGTYLKMINGTNGPYPYYQRSHATYVNTCTQKGLQLVPGSGLDDVFFSDEFIQKHPEYIRHQMFPLFMIMTLEKGKTS